MTKSKIRIYKILFSLIIFSSVFSFISCCGIREWKVVGQSMHPTMQNEQIYLGKDATSIARGDIIFFHYRDKVLVKRVIGIAGDEVILKLPIVIVNREIIDEPYLLFRGDDIFITKFVVGKDEFFVLGDNRPDSWDSRFIGCIKRENVVGKVLFRIW